MSDYCHPILRGLLFWLCALLGLAAHAGTFSVLLDQDRNAATGCSVTAASGGPVAGVDVRLNAVVDGAPPVVTAASLASCDPVSGTFGPATVLPAGIPVGLNLGVAGADVIEFDVPLTALGVTPGQQVNLTVTAFDGLERFIQGTAPGAVIPGQPTQPTDIPTLSEYGLWALAALLTALVWRQRRRHGWAASAILLALPLLALAANHVSDGQIGDWAGESPIVTSPPGDTTDASTDVRQVFMAEEGGRLFFRIDVTQLEQLVSTAVTVRTSGPASATEGQTVSMTAITGGGAGTASYLWRQTAGPDVGVTGQTGAALNFTAPTGLTTPTTLIFEVTATSGASSASSLLQIVIQPANIAVDAGQDRSAFPGDLVSLHATGQSPGGGFSWTQVSPAGTPVTLTGANTANPAFTAPAVAIPTELVFQVAYTQGGKTASDRVTVRIAGPTLPPLAGGGLTIRGPSQQKPLVVVAPPVAEVPLPAGGTTQQLGALASGGDGNYTWFWKEKGAPVGPGGRPTLGPTDGPVLSVTLPAVSGPTTYAFTVEITDGSGAIASDSTTLFAYPSASPSPLPLDVFAPSLSASEGPVPVVIAAAAQGGAAPYTYRWTQTAGPSVALSYPDDPDRARATFLPPAVDADTALTFEVTATDSASASATKAMNVLVRDIFAITPPQALRLQPLPPVDVVAGQTLNLAVGATGGSPPYSWSWQQTGGTPASVSGATTDTLTLTAPPVTAAETATFRVTATDTASASAAETVQVRVLPTPPTSPLTVVRIPDQHADEGAAVAIPAVAQGGTGNYRYRWTFLPGSSVPSLALTGADTSIVRFTAPQVAARTPLSFSLQVTDGVSSATLAPPTAVVVIVNDITPPLALKLVNPDPQLTVTTGDTVTLSGGQPQGGQGPYAIAWSQIAPATPAVTLSNGNTANPTFLAPPVTAPTAFTFQMRVTDALGNAVTQTQSVTVNPLAPLVVQVTGPAEWTQAGVPFHLNVAATGGTPPYTYRTTGAATGSGQVTFAGMDAANPSGTADSAALAGGPTVTFTATVTDSGAPPQVQVATFAVKLVAPAAPVGPAPLRGYVCGDPASQTPCTPLEKIRGPLVDCPADKPYLMNDIYQEASRPPNIYKRCVDEATCKQEWWFESSDKVACFEYDPTVFKDDLVCHLCCTTDGCNRPTLPPENTLFKP